MLDQAQRNRVAVNIWTARIIPIVLAGIVGYATYVFVALLCVNYLLVKHDDKAATIPILVIYFILFILMAVSFFRLLYITLFDPPYVALGEAALRELKSYNEKGKYRSDGNGIGTGEYNPGNNLESPSPEVAGPVDDRDIPGLELFYTRDIFVCEMDGKPKWCSQCANWKPDRAHHCSSSERCIRKMDHFCPWVGGPVGESNYKFFIQFTAYTALYCTHLLIVMAIFIHKQVVTEGENVNRQFCAILGLAVFFGLFTASMAGTSLGMTMNNLSQVEKLGAKTKVHILGVIKPPPEEILRVNPGAITQYPYSEITYPLGVGQSHPKGRASNELPLTADSNERHITQPLAGSQSLESQQRAIKSAALLTMSTGPPDLIPDSLPSVVTSVQLPISAPQEHENPRERISARDLKATRTFGIVRLKPGDNPWDLGSRRMNLQSVMGTNVFDYFLPIRRSPCCRHEDTRSHFEVGPVVDLRRAECYGIKPKDQSFARALRKQEGEYYNHSSDTQDDSLRSGSKAIPMGNLDNHS